MSSEIQFGCARWVIDEEGETEWVVEWDPEPKEDDGTTSEFSFAPGTPYRANANAHAREWIASSRQAATVAELISLTPGYNELEVTMLSPGVMAAINNLPDGPDAFSAEVSRWFRYWAKRAREEFGEASAVMTY